MDTMHTARKSRSCATDCGSSKNRDDCYGSQHSFCRMKTTSLSTRRNAARVVLCVNRVRPTFFHSAATCLHLPARLTRESTKREGRKPRTSERHVVGCCEVLCGMLLAWHWIPKLL